jgi:uncharacterized phage-associated protein
MNCTKIIVHAIHYLLSRTKAADKLKIVKLIFLADKYNLNLYGRTITGDIYFAMEKGPVGSTTKDILDFNMDYRLTETDIEYIDVFLKKIDSVTYEAKPVACNYDMLSKSDRQTLDYIIKHFGNLTNWELVALTHLYPEWEKHEKALQEGTRSIKIELDDMFSYIDRKEESIKRIAKNHSINISKILPFTKNDPISIDPEHMAMSKEMLNGMLC